MEFHGNLQAVSITKDGHEVGGAGRNGQIRADWLGWIG